MTDYEWGLLVGGIAGYVGALITMIVMWSLCLAAHDEKVGEDES